MTLLHALKVMNPFSIYEVIGIVTILHVFDCKFLIPKLAMLTLRAHYKPENCVRIMEFLLFSYRRLCTVAFGLRYNGHP